MTRGRHGCDAVLENGPAAPELRHRCASLHHGRGPAGPAEYKCVARVRVRHGELPSDREIRLDRTSPIQACPGAGRGPHRRRGAAARSRRSATNTPDPRPIWSSATSRPPVQTSCGSPTSPRPSPGQACMGLCSVKPDLSIRGELAVAHANACYTLVFGRSVRTSTMMQ